MLTQLILYFLGNTSRVSKAERSGLACDDDPCLPEVPELVDVIGKASNRASMLEVG